MRKMKGKFLGILVAFAVAISTSNSSYLTASAEPETEVVATQTVYHIHDGDETNGGYCYGEPIYHVHEGDPTTSGGCYNVETTGTAICNYSVGWYNATRTQHCTTCINQTAQTYHSKQSAGHTCGTNSGEFYGYYTCNTCGTKNAAFGWDHTSVGNYSHEYTTTIYEVDCGMTEETILGYSFNCALDETLELFTSEIEKTVGDGEYALSVNTNVLSDLATITGYSWSDGTTEGIVRVTQNAVYSCTISYTDNGAPKTAIIGYEVTDCDMVPPTLAIDFDNVTSEIVVTELTDNFTLHEMPVRYFNGTEWTEWTTTLTYSVSAGGVYMVQARDSMDNIAEASISLAPVTCIDQVNEIPLDLGTYIWIDKVGNLVSSSSLGTDTTPDLYYDGYTFVTETTETLVEEGVTVYRYFTPTTHILTAYSGTEYFLGSPVMSSQIESLLFEIGNNVPDDAIGAMDVRHSTSISSVFMWWHDRDADGLYEVTIASKKKTELFADSSYLFKGLSSCIKIEGMSGNVTMANVTNSTGMFEDCVSLRQLDAPLAVKEEIAAELPMFEGRKWVERSDYCEAYTATYTKLPTGLDASMTIVSIPNEINSTYKIALPATMNMVVEIIPATEESAEKYVIKASETISIAYCMPSSSKKLVVKTEFVDADPKIVLGDGTAIPLTVTTYVPDENGELQLLENNMAVYQQPSESYELQTKQIELRISSEEMDVDFQSGTYECTNIQFVIDIED